MSFKCLLEDSGSSLKYTTPLHVALMLKYYAGVNEVASMSRCSSTFIFSFLLLFLDAVVGTGSVCMAA